MNHLIFYKKKESTHFIAIFTDKEIIIFDLENEKKLEAKDCQKLIDFEYEYAYMLRFDGCSRKRKGSDNIDTKYLLPFEKKQII